MRVVLVTARRDGDAELTWEMTVVDADRDLGSHLWLRLAETRETSRQRLPVVLAGG